MQTRRGIVLLVIVCLLRAAVPIVGDSTKTVEEPGGTSYACVGHVCGCRTVDDCRRACCCTKSQDGRSPTTPVYSPCSGGGPQVIPTASTLVAVLPPAFVGMMERAGFAQSPATARVVSAPSLEPSTPPPRGAVAGT